MEFVITDRLRHAITVASKLKGLSGKESSRIGALQTAEAISLADVSMLSETLREHADTTYQGPKWVHDLLDKSEVYVAPPPPPKPKDPKLVARLQRMQNEIDNRKYMKMVRDVSFLKQREADLDRIELRSVKTQASIGYNIVFTTLTAFAVGWFIGQLKFGGGTTAIVIGAVLAILALVGETLLFIISGTRRDQAMSQRMYREERGQISPFGENATPSDKVSVEQTLTDAPPTSITAKED